MNPVVSRSADLRSLLPGYGATAANLTAVRHQQTVARQLRGLQGVQAELARARLARLRRLAAEVGTRTVRSASPGAAKTYKSVMSVRGSGVSR